MSEKRTRVKFNVLQTEPEDETHWKKMTAAPSVSISLFAPWEWGEREKSGRSRLLLSAKK